MKLLKFLSNRIVVSIILIVIQMIWIASFMHFLFIDSSTLRWLFIALSMFVTLYIINNDDDDHTCIHTNSYTYTHACIYQMYKTGK